MKLSGGVLSTLDPSSFRHYRWACKFSLKVMVSAVLRLRHALVFTVRNRTVAKLLSIGLVVSSCQTATARTSSSPSCRRQRPVLDRFASRAVSGRAAIGSSFVHSRDNRRSGRRCLCPQGEPAVGSGLRDHRETSPAGIMPTGWSHNTDKNPNQNQGKSDHTMRAGRTNKSVVACFINAMQ